MRLLQASGRNRAIHSRNWNHEGAKVTSSTANILELNGVNATTEWPANFRSGDVLKIQFKKLKTGDTIMILFTPRSTVLKRVMVV